MKLLEFSGMTVPRAEDSSSLVLIITDEWALACSPS